jgi:hypothetical protein
MACVIDVSSALQSKQATEVALRVDHFLLLTKSNMSIDHEIINMIDNFIDYSTRLSSKIMVQTQKWSLSLQKQKIIRISNNLKSMVNYRNERQKRNILGNVISEITGLSTKEQLTQVAQIIQATLMKLVDLTIGKGSII